MCLLLVLLSSLLELISACKVFLFFCWCCSTEMLICCASWVDHNYFFGCCVLAKYSRLCMCAVLGFFGFLLRSTTNLTHMHTVFFACPSRVDILRKKNIRRPKTARPKELITTCFYHTSTQRNCVFFFASLYFSLFFSFFLPFSLWFHRLLIKHFFLHESWTISLILHTTN